jgi:lipopolysaccharide transport system permease protein
MLLFFLMMAYYAYTGGSFTPNAYVLLFPMLILLMALLGLGLGLIITAMTTKYRDLAFLITFGVQLMMYGTTVIYPLSSAPAKYRALIELNPMTGIIEAFRYGFLGQGEFTVNSFGYSVAFTLLALVLGVIIFNKTEKTFVDTV